MNPLFREAEKFEFTEKGKTMFGLKPDDALHVMEHSAHVRRVFAAADEEDEAAHKARMRNITKVFQTRSAQEDRQKLRAELNELGYDRNEVVADRRAGAATINELIAEIAFLRDEPVNAVRLRVNRARTAHYDKVVDEFLLKGSLGKDPRTDAELMKAGGWYTP